MKLKNSRRLRYCEMFFWEVNRPTQSIFLMSIHQIWKMSWWTPRKYISGGDHPPMSPYFWRPSIVDRPTQLIWHSDIDLLSWRWWPLWSCGTLYQWPLRPKQASYFWFWPGKTSFHWYWLGQNWCPPICWSSNYTCCSCLDKHRYKCAMFWLEIS